MTTVTLVNAKANGEAVSSAGLVAALQRVASAVPQPPNQYDSGALSPSEGAVYLTPPFFSYTDVEGNGFTYNAAGLLVGGTITTINIHIYGPPDDQGSYASSAFYSGLDIPVTDAASLGASSNPAAVLLAGGAVYYVNSAAVQGYAGNDDFVIEGAGIPNPSPVFPPPPPVTSINGEGGVNSAEFPNAMRGDATIVRGGGDETVIQGGITASLSSIDTLTFIDGSIYEDNGSVGAQAALMFLGIMGRMPDPTNAGGFALIAQQTGTSGAGDAILATEEGESDTAGLTNAQYVSRLYQNMLHGEPSSQEALFWQHELDSGALTRGGVAASLAASPQAQIINAPSFTANTVFAADPGAVDVLRAYDVMLNRLPETSSLKANAQALDNHSLDLQTLYAEIQTSQEFASLPPNQYGITATTSYDTVYGITHSDAVTAMLAPFITADGGIAHLTG